jgi:hypothetical protein
MFAPLMDAVRADIDRQIGWVRGEVRRQTRHTALISTLAAVAARRDCCGAHRPLLLAFD